MTINHEEQGEDSHGLQKTNFKNLDWTFQVAQTVQKQLLYMKFDIFCSFLGTGKTAINLSINIYLSLLLFCKNLYELIINKSSSKRLLVVPRYNLKTYGRRAFSVNGPMLWNSLPNNIRETESLSTLKKQIKTFLFKRSF